MSVQDDNKALFTRFIEEAWNAGNVNAVQALVNADYQQHIGGGTVQGPDGVAGMIGMWRAGFPAGRWEVADLIAERDLVGSRLMWTGTQSGDFMGTPATGKAVNVVSIGVERIRDGQIVESWREIDMLGLLQQLGVIPAQAQGTSYDQTAPPLEGATSTSTPEQNKQTMLDYVREVNALNAPDWNWAPVNQYVDEERYLWHSAAWGAQRLEHDMETYNMVKAAVPDLTFIPVEDILVAEGNKLATPGYTTGHHTGAPLFGIPASGRELNWFGIDISTFFNGKIAERWVCADILGLYQQLQGR